MRLPPVWARRVDRLGRVGVAAGAALGAAAACQTFITPPRPDITGTAQRLDGRAAQVCAFATELIAVWLPGTEADRLALHTYLTVPASVKLPETPPLLVDSAHCYTAAPKGRVADTELWSVFVATLQRPYPAAAPTRGFYQVPVGVTAGQPRAVDAPAARNTPGLGADIKSGYSTAVSQDNPAFSLVSGFVAAYLTGTPALDRYITGDSGLAPVGGYQSTQVTAVAAAGPVPAAPAAGAAAHVMAHVTARTISPAVHITYAYPLTLTAADGTWMVKSIDATPQLGNDTQPADTEAPQ